MCSILSPFSHSPTPGWPGGLRPRLVVARLCAGKASGACVEPQKQIHANILE